VIAWRPADGENVAASGPAARLLDKAISARPHDARLRLKLADLEAERYDFAAAVEHAEAALRLDPGLADARLRLARFYNGLARHEDVLALLEGDEAPLFERGLAYARLGHRADAERELRAVIDTALDHRPALRQLAKILRASGRLDELLEICARLYALGIRHAQLLYVWGSALALAGRDEEARALLLDRRRIAALTLPAPAGFADIADFNAALAEDILANPGRLSDFPAEDEANRGSSRVHALFSGRRPEFARALIESLQATVEDHVPARCGAFDPWLEARPEAARLKAWGLIQSGDDYEEWHLHPGGWLSGVYYLRVPEAVSAEGGGPGCIEFGPPPSVARARPNMIEAQRIAPREGLLLLAPSHYAHRTIPTGAHAHRISFAFDVVPDS
jgi:tetratricopeptide (TPR) repeat protein